jgi:type I restriction enzyme M protein
VTRAIREFTPQQLEFLSNVVRLYRGEAPEFDEGSKAMVAEYFAGKGYADVAGLCKAATLEEVAAQGWSLNPGRYVGVGARAADDVDFTERLEELNEELEVLNAEARALESQIAANVATLLETV